jgi:hypothetical protein
MSEAISRNLGSYDTAYLGTRQSDMTDPKVTILVTKDPSKLYTSPHKKTSHNPPENLFGLSPEIFRVTTDTPPNDTKQGLLRPLYESQTFNDTISVDDLTLGVIHEGDELSNLRKFRRHRVRWNFCLFFHIFYSLCTSAWLVYGIVIICQYWGTSADIPEHQVPFYEKGWTFIL